MDLPNSTDGWGPRKGVRVLDRRTERREVLVVDNAARGMGKCGTRLAPNLCVSEVARMARVITWRSEVAESSYCPTVVALATRNGAIREDDGFQIDTLLAAVEAHGDALVHHHSDARTITAEQDLAGEADIVVPAATQDVIDVCSAARVRATMMVEGANMPTSDAALALIAFRDSTEVPDVIANAGGAIAMDSRTAPFVPDSDQIFSTISVKVRSNGRTMLDSATERGVVSHTPAQALAQELVRAALFARGQRAPEVVYVS